MLIVKFTLKWLAAIDDHKLGELIGLWNIFLEIIKSYGLVDFGRFSTFYV